MKSKLESEAVNALESEVNRKRLQADNQSAMQNRLDALRTEFETKATELEMERQSKVRTWTVEDEEEKVRERHRVEKARQLSQLEEENKARMEAMSLINRTALEGEAQLQEVEFERRGGDLEEADVPKCIFHFKGPCFGGQKGSHGPNGMPASGQPDVNVFTDEK